jgi:hypothetical protein
MWKSAAVVLVLGLAAAPASAQQGTNQPPSRLLDVRSMTFELWCQETQQYPAERCEERRAADVRMFEDYRTAVERYELQYLKDREDEQQAQQRVGSDPSQTVQQLQDRPVQ